MASKRRLITNDEATLANGQHEHPCSDCPWSRGSLPRWLGSLTVDEWLQDAHGECMIECHTLIGSQCAGSAIYRRNVCKKPMNPEILVLPADRKEVFATPMEFKWHHS